MEAVFSLQEKRKISEANINFYRNPFVHPARTMREHDFVYILKGEWKFGQDGKALPVRRDHLLILSANRHHKGLAPCSPGTKTMYFHINCAPGDEEGGEGKVILPSVMDVSGSPNVKKYFSNLVSAKLSGKDGEAAAWFDLLLCAAQDAAKSRESYDVAEKIKNIIHKNPEKFFSNTEIGKMVNVSAKTAENKFKEAYGETIHQYMLRFKIEEAISFFKLYPELSVKEVAQNLGFYDGYHFARHFKKIRGIAPGRYKEQLGE